MNFFREQWVLQRHTSICKMSQCHCPVYVKDKWGKFTFQWVFIKTKRVCFLISLNSCCRSGVCLSVRVSHWQLEREKRGVTNQLYSTLEMGKAGELLAEKEIISKASVQKRTFWSAWHFLVNSILWVEEGNYCFSYCIKISVTHLVATFSGA